MSTFEIIVLVGVIFTIFYWLYGIRLWFSQGRGVSNASANLAFLWTLSLITVLILRITTWHLLWIFPLLYFLVYRVWVIMPLHIGGRLMILLANIGLNKQDVILKEKILDEEGKARKRELEKNAAEHFSLLNDKSNNSLINAKNPHDLSNVEKSSYYSFDDARGVIFEKPVSSDNEYPKSVFGTDFNRGIGLNIIHFDDRVTFLITWTEDDDGSSGIKSIMLEEKDQFNHFIREDMFALIYSMIKGSDNKFQIIVGGFFPEEDENWYSAADIKSVYKNFV